MKAFGNDYPLALTVGALQEITAACPDEDITRMGELINGKTNGAIDLFITMIAALSRGAEQQRKFQAQAEGGSYTPNPITAEMLRALPDDEFKAAEIEAFRVWRKDQIPTVEVAEAKKNEDAAPVPTSV